MPPLEERNEVSSFLGWIFEKKEDGAHDDSAGREWEADVGGEEG